MVQLRYSACPTDRPVRYYRLVPPTTTHLRRTYRPFLKSLAFSAGSNLTFCVAEIRPLLCTTVMTLLLFLLLLLFVVVMVV